MGLFLYPKIVYIKFVMILVYCQDFQRSFDPQK